MSPQPAEQFIRRLSSPIGLLELTSDGRCITALAIARNGHVPHEAEPERSNSILDRAAVQLTEYFAGSRRRFSLRTSVSGTPFQMSVWKSLSSVGWGQSTTYGALAAQADAPGAGRATGAAVRANRIPLIIPCHRVLDARGRITGYSWGAGPDTKAWLLEHEGISHLR